MKVVKPIVNLPALRPVAPLAARSSPKRSAMEARTAAAPRTPALHALRPVAIWDAPCLEISGRQAARAYARLTGPRRAALGLTVDIWA